jgi:hypothetical protein
MVPSQYFSRHSNVVVFPNLIRYKSIVLAAMPYANKRAIAVHFYRGVELI